MEYYVKIKHYLRNQIKVNENLALSYSQALEYIWLI